ncbi:MAG: polysaccharide biosynthesis tyrosine autokinase, partial [Bacteroidota bacterium]
MAENEENSAEGGEKIDIGTVVGKIFSHWYLFAIAMPCFLALGMWKVRFADRTYDVEAQLLIRDSDNKMQGAENLLEGMQMFSAFANIENEIGLIKSSGVINKTLDNLDFEVGYFTQGKVRTIERYHEFPFKVQLDTSHRQLIKRAFFVKVIDDHSYELSVTSAEGKTYHYASKEWDVKQMEPIKFKSTYRFGEKVHTDYFSFRVLKNPDFDADFGEAQTFFKFMDRDALVNKYKAKTQAKVLNKTASIIVIGLSDVNRFKALDFVNALADAYVDAGLEDKNQMAANTVEFIDSQLQTISDSLERTEKELETFRKSEQVMDLDFSSIKAFENLEKFQKDKAELLTKEKYYRYLLNYVTKTAVLDTLVAPSLIGISDPLLNSSLKELHQLNKEKAAMVYNSNEKNPGLIKINNKIVRTQNTLIENVNGLISNVEIGIGELDKNIGITMGRVNKLPQNERDLINIQRKFQLNDQLFNYLQEKRAEAAIAKASNIADHKVLDYAVLKGNGPSSPNAGVTYVMYLVLGIMLPVVFVVAKSLIQNKLAGEAQLKRQVLMPFVGSVANNNTEEKVPLMMGPKTQISESVRITRSNLQHKMDPSDKVIGITSTVMGEGKSFLAANLAASFALSGKRTVVLGTDLRKPMLHDFLDKSNNLGLITYLNDKADLQDVLLDTNVPNLKMITSGPATLFPSEQLGSQNMIGLMQELKNAFDIIILDSPPVRVVSDYYVLSKYTNVDLFVCRNNYTKNKYVKEINELFKKKRLPNMMVVLNDFQEKSVSFKKTYKGYYEFTRRVPR